MREARTVKNVYKNISGGKGSLESQEREGCTMLKMTWRKWMFQAGENRDRIQTPGNWSWSRQRAVQPYS